MAKIVKKISKAIGFSKNVKSSKKNGLMSFVESFVESCDPKMFTTLD